MSRTTERGSKTITLFNLFNRKLTLRYSYTKYYRESYNFETNKVEKSYWNGKDK
jgi:hypothetical protein